MILKMQLNYSKQKKKCFFYFIKETVWTDSWLNEGQKYVLLYINLLSLFTERECMVFQNFMIGENKRSDFLFTKSLIFAVVFTR